MQTFLIEAIRNYVSYAAKNYEARPGYTTEQDDEISLIWKVMSPYKVTPEALALAIYPNASSTTEKFEEDALALVVKLSHNAEESSGNAAFQGEMERAACTAYYLGVDPERILKELLPF